MQFYELITNPNLATVHSVIPLAPFGFDGTFSSKVDAKIRFYRQVECIIVYPDQELAVLFQATIKSPAFDMARLPVFANNPGYYMAKHIDDCMIEIVEGTRLNGKMTMGWFDENDEIDSTLMPELPDCHDWYEPQSGYIYPDAYEQIYITFREHLFLPQSSLKQAIVKMALGVD